MKIFFIVLLKFRILFEMFKWLKVLNVYKILYHTYLLFSSIFQETKIKTAILDYLKRFRPGDMELYTMVALKFMMYREIAQLLEDNANQALDKLSKRPLGNNTSRFCNSPKMQYHLFVYPFFLRVL